MGSKMGRPPVENPKTDRLYVRVSPREKKEIQDFSREHDKSILELIRLGIESEKRNN